MKKILVVFSLFCAMVLMISCGDGSKNINQNNEPDTGETVTDGDTTNDSDPSDSGYENPDTVPEQPDGGDTAPDNGDTEPDNDYPQTPCDPNPCISDTNSTGACTIKNNSYVCGCIDGYIFDGTLCIKSLPECSPANETPCIDSATGLIWSAKSESKMPWNDAVEYCDNLTEGDFNDWRLPSIVVLKTLVQNCSLEKCADDYTGKYSKFADTVYLWSASESEGSTALSIYFSNASTQPVSIDDNVNVRCVRREVESRQLNCTGLIENSVWNTATQITQTWDWETAGWTPSPEGSYNAEGSSSDCRFTCDSSSFWDGTSKCLNPCEPNLCNSLGETGKCVGTSATTFSCECEENYFWDGYSHCLNPCKPNPCTGIGETGICVGKSANKYTCECENNYVWNPYSSECMKNPCNIPNSTGVYNPVSETQYICECEDNYFWDNSSTKCLTPCKPNSCTSVANSTGICVGTSANEYACECEDNYFWDGTSKCLNPCDINPCEEIANSTPNSCNPSSWNQYSCGCESGYYWWGSKNECIDKKPLTLGNICTGQNKCYNNEEEITCPTSSSADFFGQDAYYANLDKCTPQSFTIQTISSQNVVFDNNTDLMWQQTIPTEKYTWDDAGSYCDWLTYAGYSDWRLPTPQELLTIVDNSRYKPAIDTTYFPDTPPSSYFWSSSTDNSFGDYDAWYVGFDYGLVDNVPKTAKNNVRCVRGATLPTALFQSSTVNGDEIVTDTKTGLVWQKSYVSGKTWQEALSYCEGLTYAGYSDWRLPNRNELSSLVNYEKSYSDFPDMPSDYFWSSSTGVSFTDSAYFVHFSYGDVYDIYKTGNNIVRCVR